MAAVKGSHRTDDEVFDRHLGKKRNPTRTGHKNTKPSMKQVVCTAYSCQLAGFKEASPASQVSKLTNSTYILSILCCDGNFELDFNIDPEA
ncbi:uncharacterized protein V6R79_019402 [Siganus canaliculatus]